MSAPETAPDTFRDELTALIPHLRAFARSLCNDATLADDLAQEALLKAWKSREAYIPGTNMKAWAFTILRNHFYSETRRSWRRQPLDPEVAEATLVAADDPAAALDLLSIRNAMNLLSADQREALILVGAGGMSYEEAASVCGCAVGTVKSRVSRARKALEEIISQNGAGYSSDDSLNAADAFEDLVQQAEDLSRGRDPVG
ncbi:MAG: sigma-70 family RNA polymerase sigma factor [Hyphomonadaceae bacterium]